MEEKRDSFIFYRSFFEALCDLPEQNQIEVYRAISEFSLNFNEVELTGISSTIFKLIKPQLEANNKRFINGKQPKQKQSKSKKEAKQKQKVSKPEANNNVNVNDNVNKNDNIKIPSFEVFKDYALSKKQNISIENLKLKYDSWVENGWKDGTGKQIKNWKSKLLNTIPYIKENERKNEPIYKASRNFKIEH